MQLGTKLRMLRKKRGYTLADMSDEIGLSVSFLSDVERGRTKPSLDTLEKLASFHQMTINDLLGEVDIDKDTGASPGFEEFLKEKETEIDEELVDLLLKVERRARKRAQTKEDWQEYYYSLKRILGR